MSDRPTIIPGPGERTAIVLSRDRVYSRENFSKNLRTLLGVHGLTAAQTAKLLGISANTLSYWLKGERDPQIGSLEKLAQFFEVDGFKLLGQYTGSFLMEELADLDRWQRIEHKIEGEQKKVVPLKKTKGKS